MSTRLFDAITFNNVARLNYLLKSAPAVRSKRGWTALHHAVACAHQKSSLSAVRLLLQRGADVNVRDARGWTPLHVAASGPGYEPLYKELLKHGATPNPRPRKGQSKRLNPATLARLFGHRGPVGAFEPAEIPELEHAELDRALLADQPDLAHAAVIGDALLQAGDFRGQWVASAMMGSGSTIANAQLERSLGQLGAPLQWLGAPYGVGDFISAQFRGGVLFGVAIKSPVSNKNPGGFPYDWRPGSYRSKAPCSWQLLYELLKKPWARWVRSIRFTGDCRPSQLFGTLRALPPRPGMRSLVLQLPSEHRPTDLPDQLCFAPSLTRLGLMLNQPQYHGVGWSLPKLETLELRVPGSVEQLRLHAPALKRVHIRAQAMHRPAVDWLLRHRNLSGKIELKESIAPITRGQLRELHPRCTITQ